MRGDWATDRQPRAVKRIAAPLRAGQQQRGAGIRSDILGVLRFASTTQEKRRAVIGGAYRNERRQRAARGAIQRGERAGPREFAAIA